MRLTLSIFLLAIASLSFAQQDTTGRIDLSHFTNCLKTHDYTSKEFSNDLIGSWKLTKQYCYGTHKQDLSKAEVIITFMSSGAYSVTKNSKKIETGKWRTETTKRVVHFDRDNGGEYLSIYGLLCGDEFYFNDVGSDGCECLYVKISH